MPPFKFEKNILLLLILPPLIRESFLVVNLTPFSKIPGFDLAHGDAFLGEGTVYSFFVKCSSSTVAIGLRNTS